MDATLLLCDSAQEAAGKLFILGGGWNLLAAGRPVNVALAILIEVPWDQTNDPIKVEARLMTDDGDKAQNMEGHEVFAAGEIEVGRPPGLKRGQNLNSPLALQFANLALHPGGYRWELHINGDLSAKAPFRAVAPA